MKKSGFWISLFMVVSVLAGLCLPRLTFAWQAQNSGSRIEECTAKNVGLTYSNDVIDSLRLFSEGYRASIDVSGETIHTKEEMIEKAKELLYRFEDYGINFVENIDEAKFWDVYSFLVLPTDSESTYSAIIWELSVGMQAYDSTLFLDFDDASGKMISFQWYFPELETEQEVTGSDGLSSDVQAQRNYDTWGNVDMLLEQGISDLFQEYYGLNNVMESLFGKDQDTYLEFTFFEQKYGKTTVPVWIYRNSFTFNPAGARAKKQ